MAPVAAVAAAVAPGALQELPRPPRTMGALADRTKFGNRRCGRAAVAGSLRERARTIAAAAAAAAAAVLAAACCC